MKQIQKLSKILLVIFNCLLVGIPLFTCCLWLSVGTIPFANTIAENFILPQVHTPEGYIPFSEICWNTLSKMIILFSNGIGVLPVILGLFFLKKIFTNYKKGEIFSLKNANYYQKLGLLFFLDAFIAKPISHMLLILGVTLSNSPGHRYISLSFGNANIEALFCGLIIIVISWVMAEGYKIDKEQRYTV